MVLLLVLLNRLWNALSPLKEAWRTLMNVLEAVAPYARWCLGCGLVLALVVLVGAALVAPFNRADDERDCP